MTATSSDDSPPDGPPLALRFEYANENRQATIGLGGTGVAILTFLLIFLNERYTSGGLDALLYRVTLGAIVLSIFFLGLSGSYYYFLIEALERQKPATAPLLQRAETCFVAGFVLLLLEPALILFTLQIYDIGILAAGCWVASMLIVGNHRRAMNG